MIKPCDLRSRSRVRLNLPARIRQMHPGGELAEVTRTLDVSRHGFAFRTRLRYSLLGTLWVALPYSAEAAFTPEFPGAPVRIEYAEDGSARVAVQFHSAQVERFRRALRAARSAARQERRNRSRAQVTVPVRVRHAEFTDESVTLDISRGGLLFRSQRPYTVDQPVAVAMPYQPGQHAAEVPARVARIIDLTGELGRDSDGKLSGVRAVALEFTSDEPPARGVSIDLD